MAPPFQILVTGAAGFVGQAVVAAASRRGWNVRAASRRRPADLASATFVPLEDLAVPSPQWTENLRGVDVVIHCAARVHVMRERSGDPLAEFRRVNVDGTRRLAEAAAAAGVRRFVFVSSIKVNGEETRPGRPFCATDEPAPEDAYGVSKWEAERALADVARTTGLEVAVVRSPLVYGPGVQANFQALMRAIARGRPLPLGGVDDNRRTLVGRGNLADLLLRVAEHPAAPGRVWLAADGESVSTVELCLRIGRAVGHPARLLPVPVGMLRLAATLAGRGPALRRLIGSLEIDASATRTLLGWQPPFSMDEELRAAASRPS